MVVMPEASPERRGWRYRVHEVIFEADTRAGKAFDVFLLWAILLSVAVVLLESVPFIREVHGTALRAAEWTFTILFSIEYVLRLLSVGRPSGYALSTYGIIDLLAIAPTYVSLVFPGAHSFLVIRALRLLRVFRVLKLARFLGEARQLRAALWASLRKVTVFLITVLALVVIIGAIIYLIEGEEHGFTSIPTSIYWAIVTMTTVGYGDLVPQTVFGKLLASAVMIIGYAIIAVPTGIVSVELAYAKRSSISTQACLQCSREGHDDDAEHCKYCGAALH